VGKELVVCLGDLGPVSKVDIVEGEYRNIKIFFALEV